MPLDTPTSLTGLTVLVVEDQNDEREVLACLLEMRGARVHDVPSSDAAMEYLAQHTPHLMISDISMPGRDGYSLMRHVRTERYGAARGLPSIALTALTGALDRRRALEAGFDRHLQKPVQSTSLLRSIGELCGLSRRAGA